MAMRCIRFGGFIVAVLTTLRGVHAAPASATKYTTLSSMEGNRHGSHVLEERLKDVIGDMLKSGTSVLVNPIGTAGNAIYDTVKSNDGDKCKSSRDCTSGYCCCKDGYTWMTQDGKQNCWTTTVFKDPQPGYEDRNRSPKCTSKAKVFALSTVEPTKYSCTKT